MRKQTIKTPLKIAISVTIAATFLCQNLTNANEEKPQLVLACTTEQECKSLVETAKKKREKLAEEQRAIESKSAPLKAQVQNLIAQLELYQTEIIVTNMELSKLKAQQGELNTSIDKNKEKIKERLMASQLSIETNKTLNFIANSTSITEFIERMQVVNDLSAADHELIQLLNEQVKSLKENEEKQTQHLREVEKLTADAESLKATKKAELDKYLAEVQQKVREQQNQTNQSALSEQQLKELEEAKDLAGRADTAANPNTPSRPTPTPSRPTPSQPSQPSQPSPSQPSQPTPPAPSGQAASGIIETAKKYMGVPYVWGGTTPRGFDCSGFTSYVYREATGKNIGRVTTNQEHAGTVIGVDQAQPGDLLFWGPRGGSYHVAIYLGNGQYIHAPYAGRTIEISNFKYFRPNFALRVS